MPYTCCTSEHPLPHTARRPRASAVALAVLTTACLQAAVPGSAHAVQPAAVSGNTTEVSTRSVRLEPVGSLGGDGGSEQLVFSPTGDRVAHRDVNGLELWSTQPLKRLIRIPRAPLLGLSQLLFSPNGQLHYINGGRHGWITADLGQGIGSKADLLSPNGRYAVRNGPRPGEDDFTPNYYGAVSDVYDLQEKRSVCQFPRVGWLSNAAFTDSWFANQLAPTGPQPPKPLAVCEMATGRAFIMPFGDARRLTPTLDPQGRWLMVHSSGTRLLGMSEWSDRKLFALPFAREAFAKNPDNEPYPCAELPCGHPEPVATAELPPDQPVVSPDGSWLVYLNHNSIKIFKSPEMKQVATLAHAPYTRPPTNRRTGQQQVAFSTNGRWLGLQVNSHLYRIDLQSSPLRLQELTPPVSDFNLQAISSDGLHWLVQHETEPQRTLQGALWRADLSQ